MTAPRAFKTKVLAERAAASPPPRLDDAALIAGGGVVPMSEGLVALRGVALEAFRFFEAEFLQLARRFGAEEVQYPVLLPRQILEEVGYFGHFPQHVTLCSHLPEDLPLLQEVARVAVENGGKVTAELLAKQLPPEHALKPAVCLPCYRELRGLVLDPGQQRAVTMQNHVFRREPAGYDLLARLWDFHVRDLVLIGDYPTLSRQRQAVMDEVMALCEALDLSARLELANDPFFLDPSAHKAVYQRLGEVKIELVLPVPHRDLWIAASSFNLHRSFYASVYGLRTSGGALLETACMGFGLERWVYAFLSQKGLDPARWPERAQSWRAAQPR